MVGHRWANGLEYFSMTICGWVLNSNEKCCVPLVFNHGLDEEIEHVYLVRYKKTIRSVLASMSKGTNFR